MKKGLCILLLATGTIGAANADLGRSPVPHLNDALPSLRVDSDPSKTGKMAFERYDVANDYCNTRCGQQFNTASFVASLRSIALAD